LIPNFAKRVPRSDAKFGIGALEGFPLILQHNPHA
jgi:hypothetical protein